MEQHDIKRLSARFDALHRVGSVLAEQGETLSRERYCYYLCAFCKRLCDLESAFASGEDKLDQRFALVQLEVMRASSALHLWISNRDWDTVPLRDDCASRLKGNLKYAAKRLSSLQELHQKYLLTEELYAAKFKLLNNQKPSNTASDNISRLNRYVASVKACIIGRIRSAQVLPSAFCVTSRVACENVVNVPSFKDHLCFAKTVFSEWSALCDQPEFSVSVRDPRRRYNLEKSAFAFGAYGKVFKASRRSSPLRGSFAVKIVELFHETGDFETGDTESSDELRGMHLQEASFLFDAVKSAFVVRFVEFIDYRNTVFIVTALCSHGSLRSIVNNRGEGILVEDLLKYVLLCVLSALVHLHEKNIYHGDIKGENLLLSNTGIVQLADFGNAHSIFQERAPNATPGTPHFMAPEIVNAMLKDDDLPAPEYGTGIDVWALGITTIELVEMNPPMANAGYMSALVAGKYGVREDFDFRNPEVVPFGIKEIVNDCLVILPAERHSAASLSQREYFRTILSPHDFLHRMLHV